MRSTFTNIEAVVFDIGGVFLVPHPEPIAEALGTANLTVTDDPAEYRKAHYHGARGLTDRLLARQQVDELDLDSWRDYDLRYFAHLGIAEVDLGRAHTARATQRDLAVADVWRLALDENIAAFHQLAAAGWRVAILSNNDGTAAQQMEAHGVCQVGPGDLPAVEMVIDSTVVKIAKPDPAIFHLLLSRMGLEPEQVLYIGDTVHADVNGATAAGIGVVQLDPLDLHRDFDHHRAPDVAAVAELLNGT